MLLSLRHYGPILAIPGVQLRLHDTTLYASIFRVERLDVDERIEEILRRYPAQSPVNRAIQHAEPILVAHVRRTLNRLDEAEHAAQ
ncbi:hypothetical protein [Micromonospora sp. NPDC023956]|uniref:hypothetical protein n=1 Tax=Micromonospora sp. NPDC023956 TaxID=3155722 RepID=UPI003403A4DA